MSYTRDITDVLRDLIQGMQFPVIIGTVIPTADGYTLRCNNIYHAQNGFDVAINGNTFRIISFDQSTENITITGTGTINTGDTFEMYDVKFFHGTPVATGLELQDLDNSPVDNGQQKTPMIWLWENFKEKITDDYAPLGREIDCELFFLTQADAEAFKTQDFYDKAIKPMRRVVDLFQDAVKADRATFFASELPYSVENYSKFGVYIREKGSNKNIMQDKLSGIGIKILLKLYNTRDECPPPFSVDGVGIGFGAIGTMAIA